MNSKKGPTISLIDEKENAIMYLLSHRCKKRMEIFLLYYPVWIVVKYTHQNYCLLQTNEKGTFSIFFIKKMINNDRQMRGKINLSTKLSFVALGPLVFKTTCLFRN